MTKLLFLAQKMFINKSVLCLLMICSNNCFIITFDCLFSHAIPGRYLQHRPRSLGRPVRLYVLIVIKIDANIFPWEGLSELNFLTQMYRQRIERRTDNV